MKITRFALHALCLGLLLWPPLACKIIDFSDLRSHYLNGHFAFFTKEGVRFEKSLGNDFKIEVQKVYFEPKEVSLPELGPVQDDLKAVEYDIKPEEQDIKHEDFYLEVVLKWYPKERVYLHCNSVHGNLDLSHPSALFTTGSAFTYGTSRKPIVFKIKYHKDFYPFYEQSPVNPLFALFRYFISKYDENQKPLVPPTTPETSNQSDDLGDFSAPTSQNLSRPSVEMDVVETRKDSDMSSLESLPSPTTVPQQMVENVGTVDSSTESGDLSESDDSVDMATTKIHESARTAGHEDMHKAHFTIEEVADFEKAFFDSTFVEMVRFRPELYRNLDELNDILHNNDGSVNITFNRELSEDELEDLVKEINVNVAPEDFPRDQVVERFAEAYHEGQRQFERLAVTINRLIQAELRDESLEEQLHEAFAQKKYHVLERLRDDDFFDLVRDQWGRILVKKLEGMNQETKNLVFHMAEDLYKFEPDRIKPVTKAELARMGTVVEVVPGEQPVEANPEYALPPEDPMIYMMNLHADSKQKDEWLEQIEEDFKQNVQNKMNFRAFEELASEDSESGSQSDEPGDMNQFFALRQVKGNEPVLIEPETIDLEALKLEGKLGTQEVFERVRPPKAKVRLDNAKEFTDKYTRLSYSIDLRELFVAWFHTKKKSMVQDKQMLRMIEDKVISHIKLLPKRLYDEEIEPLIKEAWIRKETQARKAQTNFFELESKETGNYIGYMRQRRVEARLKRQVMEVLEGFSKQTYRRVMQKSEVLLSEELAKKMETFLMEYCDQFVLQRLGLIRTTYYVVRDTDRMDDMWRPDTEPSEERLREKEQQYMDMMRYGEPESRQSRQIIQDTLDTQTVETRNKAYEDMLLENLFDELSKKSSGNRAGESNPRAGRRRERSGRAHHPAPTRGAGPEGLQQPGDADLLRGHLHRPEAGAEAGGAAGAGAGGRNRRLGRETEPGHRQEHDKAPVEGTGQGRRGRGDPDREEVPFGQVQDVPHSGGSEEGARRAAGEDLPELERVPLCQLRESRVHRRDEK